MPGLSRKHLLVLLLVVGGLAAAVSLAALYRQNAFDRWVKESGGKLTPFATALLKDGKAVDPLPEPTIDTSLLAKMTEGRLALELTRGEYRYDLFGKEVWVKTHLVTAVPGNSAGQTRLSSLIHLENEHGTWQVIEVQDLALP